MRSAAFSIAERISLAEDALAEAGGEVVELAEGRVIRNAAFPRVYDANLIRRPRLELPTLGDALERLAEPLRAVGARHVQLNFDGVPGSDRLAPELRRRGFHCDRLCAMVLHRLPRLGRAPFSSARAVPNEASWESFGFVMDRLNQEEPWYSRAVSREIILAMRHRQDSGRIQFFVAEEGPHFVGMVGLSRWHGTASVVSLGTLPAWRRRGIGAALIFETVRRAREQGDDLIYLITRANDAPQELYRKLGFRVAYGFDVWLRLPR